MRNFKSPVSRVMCHFAFQDDGEMGNLGERLREALLHSDLFQGELTMASEPVWPSGKAW